MIVWECVTYKELSPSVADTKLLGSANRTRCRTLAAARTASALAAVVAFAAALPAARHRAVAAVATPLTTATTPRAVRTSAAEGHDARLGVLGPARPCASAAAAQCSKRGEGVRPRASSTSADISWSRPRRCAAATSGRGIAPFGSTAEEKVTCVLSLPGTAVKDQDERTSSALTTPGSWEGKAGCDVEEHDEEKEKDRSSTRSSHVSTKSRSVRGHGIG